MLVRGSLVGVLVVLSLDVASTTHRLAIEMAQTRKQRALHIGWGKAITSLALLSVAVVVGVAAISALLAGRLDAEMEREPRRPWREPPKPLVETNASLRSPSPRTLARAPG